MNYEQKAHEFLQNVSTVTLAVVDGEGLPWAVVVHTHVYAGGRLQWHSGIDSEHSKAIANNPNIAIVAYDAAAGGEFGFYARATAQEIERVGDESARYEAVFTEAYTNDADHVKRQLDLDILKQL